MLFNLTEKGQTLKNKAQQINYQVEKKWQKKLGASRYQNSRQTLEDLSMPDRKDLLLLPIIYLHSGGSNRPAHFQ